MNLKKLARFLKRWILKLFWVSIFMGMWTVILALFYVVLYVIVYYLIYAVNKIISWFT